MRCGFRHVHPLHSRGRGGFHQRECLGSMPAALVRSLKAFRPHQRSSRQSCRAGLHHIFGLRRVWRQRLAEQQCTEPGRKERLRKLSGFSLSPPAQPHGNNKAMISVVSVDCRGILSKEYLFPLKMEEGKGKGAFGDTLKKSGEGAKGQEEEKERLRKERERKREVEEENRVKEQELEDKIGPAPEKPLAGDCCGQGCEVCVWDTYWDDLDKYKKLLKAVEEESG